MTTILVLFLSHQKLSHSENLFPNDPRLPHGGAVLGKVTSITDAGKFIIQVPDSPGEIPNFKTRNYTFALQDAEIVKNSELRNQAVALLRKYYRLDHIMVMAFKNSPSRAILSAIQPSDVPKGYDPSPQGQLVLMGLAKRRKTSTIPKEFENRAKQRHLGIWKTTK